MSYAVVRGSPDPAQLYLDKVIDAILQNGQTRAKTREEVNLAEIIFHSMSNNPSGVHTINSSTGEQFTNEQILKRAVSVARALMDIGGTKKRVIMMVWNHEHMSALYYAMYIAGVVAFMMEPGSTEYEIQHFLTLVEPCVFFCEPECRDGVIKVAAKSEANLKVVVADGPSLDKFVEGYSDDLNSFQIPEIRPESDAIMLPTSGSTGLPKAAVYTIRGLIMQLPSQWQNYRTFPSPTRLAMLFSTGQWGTHTVMMTTCAVYQVPVLVTPVPLTPEYAVNLVEKYKPTWAFTGTANAAALGRAAGPGQLASLETVLTGGSPFAPESMAPLKSNISPTGMVINMYGLTEMQGFVSTGSLSDPFRSIGKLLNMMDYRLVNDAGEDVKKPFEEGELYLKSKCIIKGYLKNEKAYVESFTSDGWFKTGDLFQRNEQEELYFANKIKIGFKYLDRRKVFFTQINPEEHELIISVLPGVKECVTVGTEVIGPAAAVVLLPGSDLTREDIHHAINSSLQDYKRLVGGIAFVSALPQTHSGKVKRESCLQMILDLTAKGECF